MIDLSGMISVPFLKKSRFSGSYCGMRYLLEKGERTVRSANETEPVQTEPVQTEPVIRAVIWPEPYGYEATAGEKKHGHDFPFSRAGIDEAVAWLNEEYQAGNF